MLVRKLLLIFCLTLGGVLFSFLGAKAELALVSPGIGADGDPAQVEAFPSAPWDPVTQELEAGNDDGDFRGANFPFWYEDMRGLRLTLCLDGDEEEFPCAWERAPVFADSGCTELFYKYENIVGFGDEAFYFKAQSYPFDVPLDGPAQGGFAQLQLLLETTWGDDVRFDPVTAMLDGHPIYLKDENESCVLALGADLHRVEPGYEMLFARSRLRVLPGSPEGWYKMTYPYGVKTIYHPFDPDDDAASDRTEIRQVVGDLRVIPEGGWGEMQDFTIPLNDPRTLIDRFGEQDALANYIGLRETGYINDAQAGLKSIGPYLYYYDPTSGTDFRDNPGLRVGENLYIGFPANEEDPTASPGHKVLGSPIVDRSHESCFRNYFKVEYQAGNRETPPTSFGWVQVAYTDEFNVVGKIALGEYGTGNEYTEDKIPGHLECPSVMSPGIRMILLDDE